MINILLVEDEEIVAKLIKSYLEAKSTIVHVRSLKEAEVYLTTNIDIVLLDLEILDSRGLATLEYILQNRELPIIVITGNVEESVGHEAIKMGAQDFIMKGTDEFTPLKLWHKILFSIERFNRANIEIKIMNNAIKVNILINKLNTLLVNQETILAELKLIRDALGK